jgi:hypothetical protein
MIAVAKFLVVIQDLCRRLNRSDAVQHFLFRRLARTHALSSESSNGRPVAGQPTDAPHALSELCHPGLVAATACSKRAARRAQAKCMPLPRNQLGQLPRVPHTVIAVAVVHQHVHPVRLFGEVADGSDPARHGSTAGSRFMAQRKPHLRACLPHLRSTAIANLWACSALRSANR